MRATWKLLLPFAGLLTLIGGALAAVPVGKVFRIIHVHVTGVDGMPAAERKINLVGLERWSLESAEGSDKRSWHFTTDRRGNAVVRIGDFAGWDGNETRPGWGVYALVVTAGPRDAGGVSSRFWFDNGPKPGHDYDPNTENWAPEWGSFLPVPTTGLRLPIQLQRGFTLKGRIVDDQHTEKPLVGVVIDANNDLHADTHAGGGGRIFFKQTKTNAKGEFALPHCFRATTSLSIQQPAIWLRTKMGGTWNDQVMNSIEPPTRGDICEITIGATTTPRFRYFGRVVDEAGQPVANVTVDIHVMAQSDPLRVTFDEDHEAQQTVTKADGTYEFMSSTPWVINIGTEFVGDRNRYGYFQKTNDRQVLAPGQYDLQLRKVVR